MVFRDDREALKERADALEQELHEAKRKIELLESNVQPNQETTPAFFGAPLRTELVLKVDGELDDESKELVVETLRRRFGRAGQVSTVGRSLTWSIEPTPTQTSRTVSVNIRSRNGKTVISLLERHESLAGGLFGGMGFGMGFGGAAAVVALLAVFVSGLLAAMAAPLWLLAVYALARSVFVSVTRARRADLYALMNSLQSIAREDVGRGGALTENVAATRVRIDAADAPLGESDDDGDVVSRDERARARR